MQVLNSFLPLVSGTVLSKQNQYGKINGLVIPQVGLNPRTFGGVSGVTNIFRIIPTYTTQNLTFISIEKKLKNPD